MPDVTVQIDSLVVHGVRDFDPGQFAAALDYELSGLLHNGGLRGSVHVESVSLQAGPDLDSAALGQQVARAIHAQWAGGDA
jgi:hypothetical protein